MGQDASVMTVWGVLKAETAGSDQTCIFFLQISSHFATIERTVLDLMNH